MSLATFTPSIAPSPGTQRGRKINLKETEFGEGYTLATRRGYNHIRRTLQLNWEFLTLAQHNEIDGFFTGKGGDTVFYYTPPRESLPVKWTCKDWESKVRDDGFFTLSATLEQNFSLET